MNVPAIIFAWDFICETFSNHWRNLMVYAALEHRIRQGVRLQLPCPVGDNYLDRLMARSLNS